MIKIKKYLFNIIDFCGIYILYRVVYPFIPKDVWIVSEKSNQAQDNGIAFFKFLNKEKRKVNSYYLIDKESSEFENVKKIGKVLIMNSLKHKLIFLKSTVLATTEKNVIEPWGSKIFYKFFSIIVKKKVKVFLQHGIIDKDVSEVYGKKVSNFDAFITSAESERKFVVEKFGYNYEEVKCTGLTRYDELSNGDKENIILFMPTWRRNLKNMENSKYEKNDFRSSEYFKTVNGFLENKELHHILKKHGYKMKFITHYMFDEYNEHFYSNELIEKNKMIDISIKELLGKAKIFITDYSSIHFDSAYIGNLNIYYQFDQESFIQKHAGKAYFEYERDAFGPVFKNNQEVIDYIGMYLESNQESKLEYISRAEKFFKYYDRNNCLRTFEVIKKMLGEK